ncbi:hypothetical protein MYXA107069_23960 [Myxococcus xanthus]|nr:hypothetical protein MyxoNM_19090 [Myxococcus xanthus]SDY36041.1 hypothetical protein SAMN05444383_1542 [Myxococcus xanthus]
MNPWKRFPLGLALLTGCGPMSTDLEGPVNDGAASAAYRQAGAPLRPC